MEETTTPRRKGGPRPVPLAVRMERQTDKSGDCWLWTGAVLNTGYGRVTGEPPLKKGLLAHRVSFEEANGPIPDGMLLDHRCHVKLCVNPAHLRIVTNKQNREHLAGPLSNNKSGYLGVYEYFPGCWRGKVKHNGKDNYTARCATPEAADEAVRALRIRLFTHNDRDRRGS
jgi:hypothetical protein